MLLAVALFLTPAPASAQTPFLWKITNGQQVVYLLGSVHLLRESDYPLPEGLDAAYELADSVFLELSPAETAAASFSLQARGRYTDGCTLTTCLSDENRDRILKTAQERGVDLTSLNRFEPWFAALFLQVQAITQAGFGAGMGVDQHFSNRARADGKPLYGLETADDQASAFDRLPIPTQETMLLQALSGQTTAGSIVDVWRSGDVEQLTSLLITDDDQNDAAYQLLLVERNRRWAPQISELLSAPGRSSTIVIMGAAHLLGPHSVIRLLEEQGYVVEPVP